MHSGESILASAISCTTIALAGSTKKNPRTEHPGGRLATQVTSGMETSVWNPHGAAGELDLARRGWRRIDRRDVRGIDRLDHATDHRARRRVHDLARRKRR